MDPGMLTASMAARPFLIHILFQVLVRLKLGLISVLKVLGAGRFEGNRFNVFVQWIPLQFSDYLWIPFQGTSKSSPYHEI